MDLVDEGVARSDPALLADHYYLRARWRAPGIVGRRIEIMAGLCVGRYVLDVGCGRGDLLLLLHGRDRRLILAGTEISRVALGICIGRGVRARLHLTDGIPAGPFNTIVMGQFLEHIADDRAMIDAAAREMVAGGRLIVSVPNGGQVQSPDHVREYTARTLRALLRRVGAVHQEHWAGEETRLIMWAEKPRAAAEPGG